VSARDSRFAIERVAARTDGGVVLWQHVVSNVSYGYILERRREPPEAAQVRYHNVEHPNELELLSCRLCEPVHLRKSSLSLSRARVVFVPSPKSCRSSGSSSNSLR